MKDIIDSIRTAIRRHGQAREARRNEKHNAALTRARDAANGYHMGAVWLFVVFAPLLGGCVAPPSGLLAIFGMLAVCAVIATNRRTLGAVAIAMALVGCVPRHVTRAITAEHERCGAALDAAAEVSVAAFDAEGARCLENIRRIRR